ncbi:hypothetical protein GII30_19425 [Gordonia amarae]|nr:hypothetical protein [Gordonia amarae]MCS3880609.1 hypothetical protein [Gordonia amarae]QHN18920.1 hypothetical protein GII35_19780 [Gordonia amarae]QHN23395.1 hypothetical protein GII34_19280 [Gordonia amarae]QHN32296.1 hypothetical protein GII32_19595 [Gordonia amarae]QHN41044.1 hypothetical protein GII30_19425 [Gordonia amarae]
MPFTSDPELTQLRVEELDAYMREHVDDGERLVCARAAGCRSSIEPGGNFYEGQGTHVGAHYDLTEDGVDWRVMVIGMETGRGDEHVSIAERTADQNRAISMTFNQRHAHMRGTTSVLRTAFGREYGADRAGELLDLRNQGEVVHLMNAYALVNLRLCSATKGTGYRSAASSILSSNCFPHLVRTIEILEPTLCIMQGASIYRDIACRIATVEKIDANLEVAKFGRHQTLFFHGNHPSAGSSTTGYGTASASPYFLQTVEPAIREARRRWFKRS